MEYETIIGLEVHVQIMPPSKQKKVGYKMFTHVEASYGKQANFLTDPVVLALPGALPVLNKDAIDAIIKTGMMLDCQIAHITRWDRKNYFYPDSPKNYQITQYAHPVCLGGAVEIELNAPSLDATKAPKVLLTRIHLEEDVGKLNHGINDSLVDYNRAGTPLMEIVTEPVIKSADEAFAFLTSLRTSLIYAGISDCDMEKGQMRCDANISIRPIGETKLGTKVELKNLNSISYVRDGILTEIKRQKNVVTSGGTITQETRLYDGESGRSASMRSKEMAHDYRYFPDPDLMPVRIDEPWKARLRGELPERPFDRQRRLMRELGLPYSSASVLIQNKEQCDDFERDYNSWRALNPTTQPFQSISQLQTKSPDLLNNTSPTLDPKPLYIPGGTTHGHPASTPVQINVPPHGVHPDLQPPYQISLNNPNVSQSDPTLPKIAANLFISEYLRETGSGKFTPEQIQINIPAGNITGLAYLIFKGDISFTQAKTEVLPIMFAKGESPLSVVKNKDLKQSTDTGQLEGWCEAAIAGDPRSVEQVKTGNPKAINALKGAVMKLSAGKANPKLVDEILKKRLGV